MTQPDTIGEGWQPIASAPRDREILVCDTHDAKPYTIARVKWTNGAWCYSDCSEEIDFLAQFWIERRVGGNPFHLPLPNPPASATDAPYPGRGHSTSPRTSSE